MLDKDVLLSQLCASAPVDHAGTSEPHSDKTRTRERHKAMSSEAVVRLIIELELTARSELPPGQRISRLKEIEPKLLRLTARIPKPVVSARQSAGEGSTGLTLEQRLDSLMAKNLRLALDALDLSEAARSRTSAELRLWIVKGLFRFLGRQIEYSVYWDRPYPCDTWATLHELHSYLRAHGDTGAGGTSGGDSLALTEGYMRLLLLGLVRQLVPAAERSPLLYDALASLAPQSRLEPPAGYVGVFGLFVVDVTQDAPPRSSGVLDGAFNGWVLEPAPELMDLISGIRG